MSSILSYSTAQIFKFNVELLVSWETVTQNPALAILAATVMK